VIAVFTASFPKFKLDVLTPRAETDEPSDKENAFEPVDVEAVSVAVCAVLTAVTVAGNAALVAPAVTITAPGTVTAALLLPRLTENPPAVAAAFKVTVQLSVPAPVIEPFEQVSPVNTGIPVPLRLTTVDIPVDELLVSVSVPLAAPAAVGSNCTVRATV
jgi:hypothetical protein